MRIVGHSNINCPVRRKMITRLEEGVRSVRDGLRGFAGGSSVLMMINNF